MILITGNKGFIGTKLSQYFTEGYGIDLKSGTDIFTVDLPDDVDLIYHLAAQTSVEASWIDPVHDADNYKMMVKLVKRYPDARIIYANSAAALPPISSPYGFSKWVCAQYLKTFHKNYVICTFPNVYGRGSKSVVDLFKGKRDVTVNGDGLQTRDYVHVDDIVNGLVKAKLWPTGEYQMGSGIATSVLELAVRKNKTFASEKKEARESVLKNDTPDWKPVINVHDYLS